MKKLLLSALICIIGLTATALAAEERDEVVRVSIEPESLFFIDGTSQAEASLFGENQTENGFKKILNGFKNGSDSIVLNNNDLRFTLLESEKQADGSIYPAQFYSAYSDFIDKHPELFYVSNKISCAISLNSDGTYSVVEFYPEYIISGISNIKKAIKEFENLTDELAEYIMENADNDLEKALLLHDYIVLNYEYDTDSQIHDAYRFMTQGKGVCESYSKLFRYVLDLCDVEVKYSTSMSMRHVWNLVKIDNKWYHADLTWDDPTPDTPGFVSYNHFLLSDSEISTDYFNEAHYDFVNEDGVECNYSFEDSFWGIHATDETELGYEACDGSAIVFNPDNYYYIGYKKQDHASGIIERSKMTGSERVVKSFSDKWTLLGTNSFYTSCFSGLSLINGILMYNTPTEVRYILTNGNHDTLIAKIKNEDVGKGYIYRFVTSLDGTFNKKEPYYTHIAISSYDKDVDDKFSKHYRENKNMFHIEIDYFVDDEPNSTTFTERDVDTYIDFDDVHEGKEIIIRKPSFITKGKIKKVCTLCSASKVSTQNSYCNSGDDAHKPTIDDLINLMKSVIGVGPLAVDPEKTIEENDVDDDGKFSLHDINEIFHFIREDSENS